MTVRVLGIDVASALWSSNGSATISFDTTSQKFESVQPAAVEWPTDPLTPAALANAIDSYARTHDIRAVALDGPQGWRDPATDAGTFGVGRRCEFECRTQGKTGVYPQTYPSTQRGWIEFCVELFAALLAKPGVQLARASGSSSGQRYLVLECYPTSAWRTSGLLPLPGKASRPDIDEYTARLAHAYTLPITLGSVKSHDDLQAIMAALTAVGAVGGPATPIVTGAESRVIRDTSGVDRRVEGFIWNVRPLGQALDEISRHSAGPNGLAPPENQKTASGNRMPIARLRVTQRVIDQVSRTGGDQKQIALRDVPGGRHRARLAVEFELNGERFQLIVGDTHAAWRSHQTQATLPSFDRLFESLTSRPGQWQDVSHIRIIEGAAPPATASDAGGGVASPGASALSDSPESRLTGWRLFVSAASVGPLDLWNTEILQCDTCGWTGTFSQGLINWADEVVDCRCPRCHPQAHPLATLIRPADSEPSAAEINKWFLSLACPDEPEEPVIQWPGVNYEGDEEYRLWVAELAEGSDDEQYSQADFAAELKGQSSDDLSETDMSDEDGAEIDTSADDEPSVDDWGRVVEDDDYDGDDVDSAAEDDDESDR